MTRKLVRRFNQALQDNTRASSRSLIVAGALGMLIFGAYGVLWLYVTPLKHESLELRLIGMLGCLALWFSALWPAKCRKFLPWCWFATVSYALPFFSTYQLLASNYSTLRSMVEVATVFFVIVIFPNYLLAGVSLALGVSLGVLVAYLRLPDFWALNHELVLSVHLQVVLYTIVAGMIFIRSHINGLLAQKKLETMKALTASIAHEMRSPMNHLRRGIDAVGQRLPGHTVQTQNVTIAVPDLEGIYTELAKCKNSVDRGLQVIEMTLDEIDARPIRRENLRYLSAAATTRKALDEFSYQNAKERERVTLVVRQDFVFKGDEIKYLFTLFNLLKNALFYFEQYPNARVMITIDNRKVTVEDTGPGIAPESLPKVFEAFHSAGKRSGTGLGLAFCKRAMLAFGGDIVCESALGEFTRFTMQFPAVSQGEVTAHEQGIQLQANEMFRGGRILVVDDLPWVRHGARKTLTNLLGAHVDEAENGQMALDLLSAQRYDAMLLDLNMPVLDGYATAERVRRGAVPGQEHLPIVVHSAESPHAARVRLERIGVHHFVSKGCSPLDMIDALCRAQVASAPHSQVKKTSSAFSGKTIMVIDDETLSRKYIRTTLQERGFRVIEAIDGQAALDRLKKTGKIDLVIMALTARGFDGLEIAYAIRSLPHPLCRTPMIATNGHFSAELQAIARDVGISAFLEKPVKSNELLAILNRYLLIDPNSKRPPGLLGAASPMELVAVTLLDVTQLDNMRRIGLTWKDIAEGLKEVQTQLDALAVQVSAKDFGRIRERLHMLVGLSGQLGARALYDEARAMQAAIVEAAHWPIEWLPRLQLLFSETERLMSARLRA